MADNNKIEIVFSAVTDGLKKGVAESVAGIKQVETEAENAARKSGDAFTQLGSVIQDQVARTSRNSIGELARDMGRLINPVDLAITAFTTLGAAVLTYAAQGSEKILTLNQVLENHADTVKRVGLAFPEITKGLDAFEKESKEILQTRLRADLIDLGSQVKTLSDTFISSFTSVMPTINLVTGAAEETGSAFLQVDKKFEPFRSAAEKFFESAKSGTPNVAQFKQEVSALAEQSKDNEGLQTLARELLKIADNAANVAGKFNAVREMLRLLTDEAKAYSAGQKTFEDLSKTMDAISPAKVDAVAQAQMRLNEAIAKGNIEENQSMILFGKLMDAKKRQAEEEAARKKTTGGGSVEDDGMSAQMARRMQFIIDSTLTEEQLLVARYERNRTLLQEAFAIELADKALHGEALIAEKARQDGIIEALDAKHQQNLARMRAQADALMLNNLGSTFGNIGSIIESGGKKGTAAAKAMYVAQALMSTFSAATQAMANPMLMTPFQKFAAYAAVATKGLAAVASIMKAGGGGGGGGGTAAAGAGATTAAAPAPTTTFQFTMTNDPMGFGEKFARQFIDQLNSTQRNGGQIRGVIA